MSNSPLAYFINRKLTVTVITFTGAISEGCETTFEEITKEITAESSKYIILNLKGVTSIESNMKSNFVIFQKYIRDMQANLILCDLYPELKKRVIDLGIVRQGEVQKDLVAALQYVLSESKRTPA